MKRFYTIAITILIATALITSCDNTTAEYDKNITEADGFFKSENYNDALKLYKKAAGTKPEEAYPNEKIKEIEVLLNLAAAEEAEKNYYNQIDLGDNYYDELDYENAISAYTRALSFKPGEQYPLDKIEELESLMPKEEEVTFSQTNTGHPYHIIVGSFENEEYAVKLMEKLKADGFDSRLVKRYNGDYTAVILASYATINEAYNNLTDAKAQSENPWVIHKRF